MPTGRLYRDRLTLGDPSFNAEAMGAVSDGGTSVQSSVLTGVPQVVTVIPIDPATMNVVGAMALIDSMLVCLATDAATTVSVTYKLGSVTLFGPSAPVVPAGVGKSQMANFRIRTESTGALGTVSVWVETSAGIFTSSFGGVNAGPLPSSPLTIDLTGPIDFSIEVTFAGGGLPTVPPSLNVIECVSAIGRIAA